MGGATTLSLAAGAGDLLVLHASAPLGGERSGTLRASSRALSADAAAAAKEAEAREAETKPLKAHRSMTFYSGAPSSPQHFKIEFEVPEVGVKYALHYAIEMQAWKAASKMLAEFGGKDSRAVEDLPCHHAQLVLGTARPDPRGLLPIHKAIETEGDDRLICSSM